jgi:hypothetical protein
MIYVLECGPIQLQQRRDCWVVFAFDDSTRQVTTRVASDREQARRLVADELAHGPTECCPSLGEFGQSRGWRVEEPSHEVLVLAGVTLASIENTEVLGPLMCTPLCEVWLRTCAMFIDTKPWLRFAPSTPLLVTFSDGELTSRVLSVGGARSLPPSFAMLPDYEAFQRADLDDSIIMRFTDTPGVVSQALELGFGQPFQPRLLRLRKGEVELITPTELLRFTAALGAVASLATGRHVGRAVVDGLEAVVVSADVGDSLPN